MSASIPLLEKPHIEHDHVNVHSLNFVLQFMAKPRFAYACRSRVNDPPREAGVAHRHFPRSYQISSSNTFESRLDAYLVAGMMVDSVQISH